MIMKNLILWKYLIIFGRDPFSCYLLRGKSSNRVNRVNRMRSSKGRLTLNILSGTIDTLTIF
jgi:hypothetical protein